MAALWCLKLCGQGQGWAGWRTKPCEATSSPRVLFGCFLPLSRGSSPKALVPHTPGSSPRCKKRAVQEQGKAAQGAACSKEQLVTQGSKTRTS